MRDKSKSWWEALEDRQYSEYDKEADRLQHEKPTISETYESSRVSAEQKPVEQSPEFVAEQERLKQEERQARRSDSFLSTRVTEGAMYEASKNYLKTPLELMAESYNDEDEG